MRPCAWCGWQPDTQFFKKLKGYWKQPRGLGIKLGPKYSESWASMWGDVDKILKIVAVAKYEDIGY